MKQPGVILMLAAIMLISVLIIASGCFSRQSSPFPSGGMMGPGGGMMGPGNGVGPGVTYQTEGERISIERAGEIAEKYVTDRAAGLEVKEIMEFEYNFYAEFAEESTGIHAFEALIDPYTGEMYPEPGPNMMWNTKYGMMSGMMWGTPGLTEPMTITEEQAEDYAQEFIDDYLPGGKATEPDRFYGYYTLHVFKDNEIYGMLSVNGYTGQVWYHFWHGPFLGMVEHEEH